MRGRAAFTVNSQAVFKEDIDTLPTVIDSKLSYMPWGADNQMPYDIIDLIEKDETLATCQLFNAEVCYGSGLLYELPAQTPTDTTDSIRPRIEAEVEDFLLSNDLPAYFLGVCQDFKHFGFAVSVIILNADGSKAVRLLRKEACYCRFAPADSKGKIPYVLYANWRQQVMPADRRDIEVIDLLDPAAPWPDLQERLQSGTKSRKFAVVSRVPTPDSTHITPFRITPHCSGASGTT